MSDCLSCLVVHQLAAPARGMIQWVHDISHISVRTGASGDKVSSVPTKRCDLQALRRPCAGLAGGRRKNLVTDSSFSGTYGGSIMRVTETMTSIELVTDAELVAACLAGDR